MSRTRIAYRWLAHTRILIFLAALAALLTALKFLPADPLASSLPYMHIVGLRNVLLDLAVWTGLLAGALLKQPDDAPAPLLLWVYRGWSLFLMVTIALGVLGALDGRAYLELPPMLVIVLIILTTPVLAVVARAGGAWSWLWSAGVVVALIGLVVGLFPAPDPAQDRALRAIAVGLRHHVGYVLAGAAITAAAAQLRPPGALWAWGALLALAGAVVSLGPLAAVGIVSMHPVFAGAAALVYVGWLAAAAGRPASARWSRLGYLAIGLGGLVGAALAISPLGAYAQGTGLSELALIATSTGVVLPLLGVGRREQRLAFGWAAAGAAAISAAALLAGTAQVYMERVVSVGYLDAQTVLVPLFVVIIAGWACLALGCAWLALRG